jgi:hypothetical protein
MVPVEAPNEMVLSLRTSRLLVAFILNCIPWGVVDPIIVRTTPDDVGKIQQDMDKVVVAKASKDAKAILSLVPLKLREPQLVGIGYPVNGTPMAVWIM